MTILKNGKILLTNEEKEALKKSAGIFRAIRIASANDERCHNLNQIIMTGDSLKLITGIMDGFDGELDWLADDNWNDELIPDYWEDFDEDCEESEDNTPVLEFDI